MARSPRSPAAILTRAGIALYGRHWILQMSEALGVQNGEVRGWLRGRPIPAAIWPEVRVLLRRRLREIDATLREIDRL